MKTFTLTGVFALQLVLLTITTSCDTGKFEAHREPARSVDAGWGTVLKMTPALDHIVPESPRLEKLATGFGFVEGPVWVEKDRPYLLFSDLQHNAIFKWVPEGPVSTFLKPVFEAKPRRVRGPNGLTLDPQGRLVICEHGNRRISRIEKDGRRTVLVAHYQGKKLNSPNDAVYKSDGWLYFTDPPHGVPTEDGTPTKELPFSGIFRLNQDGQLELLSNSQSRPNGLAFSPDEKTLYVSNSHPHKKVLISYDVLANGTLGTSRIFYDFKSERGNGLPDGLKVDQQGNIYATGPGGVWILNPEGKHLGTIKTQERAANVAWGQDGNTLFITASTSLYRISLKLKGTKL